MLQYLLDTNIVILHVASKLQLSFPPFTVAVSTLTVYELLRYPGMTRKEEQDIREVINNCEQIPVTDRIATRAAYLARTHRIGPFDLLIAATGLELNVPLLTKNIRDFRSIPQLIVRDMPN